jgi:FKBP12-rapamycin complex-associated protein
MRKFLQTELESNVTTLDVSEMEARFSAPLCLAIPGTYEIGRPVVTIQSMEHFIEVIPSAKRPRKLQLLGSDGHVYKYLLKGHEDLRLDQRVMQLFSLTNSILHDAKFGFERHLSIRLVSIVPLDPNAGLISWADGSDTLYSMIQWHRKITGAGTTAEHQLLNTYIGDAYDKEPTLRLTAVQKLELHYELCSLAPDDDIRETLWLKSQSAELWLGLTKNFAKSNALMSIVGYLMGIGDRHASNILVTQQTGQVVHIDFSDCFEKASMRTYVHETVPFRLTRMLVKALGPSGVHGVFEITAEHVMGLMRRNSKTLLAFLEIFVQDPITDLIGYQTGRTGSMQSTEDPDRKTVGFRNAIARVQKKLEGTEFDTAPMSENEQVSKLIDIATSPIYLSQMYYGWAPFW